MLLERLLFFFCRVRNYTIESSSVREQFKNLDKLVTELNNEVLYKLDKGLKLVASRYNGCVSIYMNMVLPWYLYFSYCGEAFVS